jgi:hypothetical protein
MVLSHVNRFTVGQVIRAYEFQPMAGRNDCYHEGKVIEVDNREHGYAAYLIEVTRHVFDGQPESFRPGLQVVVPHQIAWRDYNHRILAL